jgi:hypothetical protein
MTALIHHQPRPDHMARAAAAIRARWANEAMFTAAPPTTATTPHAFGAGARGREVR